MIRYRHLLSLVFATFLTAGSVGVFAQTGGATADNEAKRLANQISYEIYSPFCPGKTLAMCPSSQAAEVRRDIQEMAASGMGEQEIKEKVITEYGEEFRYVTPTSEDNVGLFAALAGGLVLAFVAVWFLARRRGDEPAAASTTSSTPAPSDDEPAEEEPTDDDEDDAYLAELRDEYRD